VFEYGVRLGEWCGRETERPESTESLNEHDAWTITDMEKGWSV